MQLSPLRGNPVNGTGATVSYVSNFVDLKGVDTVTNKGYTNVYSDTGLAANDLLVGLRGSNKDMNNLASGHLGGITGFNGLNGSISSTASGKWFVYADNAARDDTTVGGIVGQNESNVTGTSALDTVVNCAAVRRFSRRTFWKTGNNATQRVIFPKAMPMTAMMLITMIPQTASMCRLAASSATRTTALVTGGR